MLLPEDRSYLMKITVWDMEYLPRNQLVRQALEVSKTQATAIALGYPL